MGLIAYTFPSHRFSNNRESNFLSICDHFCGQRDTGEFAESCSCQSDSINLACDHLLLAHPLQTACPPYDPLLWTDYELSYPVQMVPPKTCYPTFCLHPLLAKRPHLPSPPTNEIRGRDVDPEVLERLCAQVAIEGSLHARIGVVPFRVGLDLGDREAHDLPKLLADLILGHLILAGELENLR